MHDGSSEERITSANSSPRTHHKASTGIFSLLTKRSTKIEPHPVEEENVEQQLRSASACGHYSTGIGTGTGSGSLEANKLREHDISFAKCTTPDKKAATRNNLNNNIKSQTLPAELEKSQTGLLFANNAKSKAKPPKGKDRKSRHNSECGSQSDGGEVVLRNKTKKYRSPNHNRFSHQFSLCCRAEKPMTPPVTVRYNSIPDAAANALRRDNLSLSWSLAENSSLSSSAHDSSRAVCAPSLIPLAPLAPLASLAPLTLGASATSGITECASAPESPVASKAMFAQRHALHSSPSSASMKSIQSDAPPASSAMTINNCTDGPIRPMAVSACRSRLRLKLYPPGKALPPLDAPNSSTNAVDSIKKATTPQHMSSPNITTQPDLGNEQQGVRFISHENIQMKRKTSGSGLARQSLMAAHVLNLIPAEKARERSFLDGRLGSCSLLGPAELSRVLPTKEVTIFVGTWNMNGQSPPKQMNDFVLPLAIEHVPDIVAVGTQESSPDRFEWEVTLQETLGPSHVLFHSNTLGTLHLAVYMRRDLIWYCSAPEDASLSVRTGTAFRTKGAVAISFCLFGTSMLFVTSHLTAHQQKVKERVSDVKRITHALDLPKNLNLRHKNKDVTQNFDNVFWCGDLNFRLSEPREKLLEWIQNTKFPLPSHLPHGYMHTDQLSSVLSDGAAFRGFMEANITFPPTYKYDPGTQHFDTSSKQRAPAYTDRILYKYRQTQGLGMRRSSLLLGNSVPVQTPVECLLYDSVPSIITSDHKPVLALFKVSIRAGTDSIPLAAGLFNRDIYLEGIKRRLNNRYAGSSAVCAIQ